MMVELQTYQPWHKSSTAIVLAMSVSLLRLNVASFPGVLYLIIAYVITQLLSLCKCAI